MQTRKEDAHVRLTDEAHELLAEKAKNLDESMKEVGSEAVISLFKRELKYNEYIARINGLEKEVDADKRYAGFLFVLGTVVGGVVGGVVMFFVGGLW